MATDIGTIEFLTEQIAEAGLVTYKKMFGEYIIYLNGKPIFTVCDDTVYVKCIEVIAARKNIIYWKMSTIENCLSALHRNWRGLHRCQNLKKQGEVTLIF